MWTIQLLGGLTARSPQRQITRFRTQKAASLLAYLAFHLSPQPRETLLNMLWPDAEPEVGRHNLSNALSFLRHLLEPPGTPPGTVIMADRFTVRLNPQAVASDVSLFEQTVLRTLDEGLSVSERLSLLAQAADLYSGPLLPGYYEEWIAPQALRLENLFAQVSGRLVSELLEAGQAERALSYAQRALASDPLSEEATIGAMQALSALGQPAQALRAYRAFAKHLHEELDAQPSPALQSLARQLGRSGSASKAPTESGRAPREEAAFDLPPSRPKRTERQETAPDTAVVRSMPRGRLVGGEFLLRTTTRFFGREEEATRLGKMLSIPRTRLVTLTGPGGTGKTRLAIEATALLVERSADAPLESVPTLAVFVSLADVTEAGWLFDVILRSLGSPPASDRDPLSQLAEVLNAQPDTLLILDNFEQLAEEGALHIHDLLAAAGEVKLLVTSRQKLRIEGEREFQLAPLPTSAGAQTVEEASSVPSIALFVDRAQAALPDFHLTERNVGAVTQLCDYLEGIPLALELAAARVSVLTPARILEQAQTNRLDFLTARRRDRASRQRTLRATLDWSYQLLPEVEQRALEALSAFRGGWMLESGQAVCGLSEVEMLEALTLLRDSSLIGVADTGEGLRFTMLETIREYSQEKLMERGVGYAVQERHRDHFAALLAQANTELTGPNQAMWLDCLETEHDNLCSAIAWCETDAASAEAGLRLVIGLSRFWEVRGYLSLGRSYLERALRHAGDAAPAPERAKALHGAGTLAFHQGDYTAAKKLNERSLTIKREIGDKRGIAASLNNLGLMSHHWGDLAAAKSLYEEALTINRDIGNRDWEAINLGNLGGLAHAQGDYPEARKLHEQALAIHRELSNRRGVANALGNLGAVADALGDYATAAGFFEECLAMQRELGDWRGSAMALNNLGVCAQAQGDYAKAQTLHEESLAIRRKSGDAHGIATSLYHLGTVAESREDDRTAWSLHRESLMTRQKLEDKEGIVDGLEAIGRLSCPLKPARAVRLWGAVAARREEIGAPHTSGEKERYDRHLVVAREALGEEAFATAWTEGRAMTMEQAVAEALILQDDKPVRASVATQALAQPN